MIQEVLKIAVLQSDLVWENPEENRRIFEEKILACDTNTDIIVLPEMFTTGFTMNANAFAESIDGTTFQWMQSLAKSKNVVICGSLITQHAEKYYNTFLWVSPDGKVHSYSKKHLFRLSDEHLTYTAGEESLIIPYKGWNIRPVICYDVRFPVWCRNRVHSTEPYRGEYDLLLVVANWPERRSLAWKTLLAARSIENIAYVAACNRVGEDANKIYHSGDSAIISPLGEKLNEAAHIETTLYAELSLEKLVHIRRTYQFWRDADDFSLNA
ncbi:MAG: amidohydrolase [Chitinophagales bacterium]|jgi:predicted amidohydrolase|nr:amidohydrolase [Chitinophagales bacterium]